MPYCVRCGVELQKDYKACPLCQTEVILPGEQDLSEGPLGFPEHMPRCTRPILNLAPSRAFLFLVSFLLAVPFLFTLILDFTNNRTVTWSFYPMTSLALLWILIAYPAKLRGHTLLQVITVDILAISLFLISLDLYSGPFPDWSQYPVLSLLLLWFYVAAPLIFTWKHRIPILGFWFLSTSGFLVAIDKVTGGANWFLTLGLPIIVLVALMCVLGLALAKIIKNNPLWRAGISLFAGALFIVGVDGVVNLFVHDRFNLTWSPALSAVLVSTSIFLIVVNRSADLKAYLAKKFHI